jgi:hypothetical protein
MSQNTIIMSISDILGRRANLSQMKADTKIRLVSENVNTSRYNVALVNGTTVALKPRFHNVRNKKGQFKAAR